jgi:hypothetical protein
MLFDYVRFRAIEKRGSDRSPVGVLWLLGTVIGSISALRMNVIRYHPECRIAKTKNLHLTFQV